MPIRENEEFDQKMRKDSDFQELVMPREDTWRARAAFLVVTVAIPLQVARTFKSHFDSPDSPLFALNNVEMSLGLVLIVVDLVLALIYAFNLISSRTFRANIGIYFICFYVVGEWYRIYAHGIDDDSCVGIFTRTSFPFSPLYILLISGVKLHIVSLVSFLLMVNYGCSNSTSITFHFDDGKLPNAIFFRIVIFFIILVFYWKDKVIMSNRSAIMASYNRMRSAEMISKAKSSFLMCISHELKTPLASIKAAAELLDPKCSESLNLPSKQRAHDALTDSAHMLSRSIVDFIDIARLESVDQGITLEMQPFDFSDVLSKLINSFEVTARNKNIRFSHFIDESAHSFSRYYSGDPGRVSQIIGNLVSNSLKFTKSGFVKVTSKTVSREGDVEVVRIIIEDSGSGISRAEQEKVFEKFFRAKNSHQEGTGLGLFIVKLLVSRMGGKVRLDWSEVGVGSRFVVDIKLHLSLAPTAREEIFSTENTDSKRVLIVEDNEHLQFVFKIMLETSKHDVDIAGNGQEALEKVMNNDRRFDLILMDVNMPTINGIEASKLIFDYEKANSIPMTPVVLLTAFGLDEVRSNFGNNIVGCLTKPVEKSVLLRCVSSGGMDSQH